MGFISSLMGIGGAIMNVPILKFVGYTINKAIGTAASIGFLISIFGTIGFLSTGIIMQKNTFKYWFYKYSCFFNIYSNYNYNGKNWCYSSS